MSNDEFVIEPQQANLLEIELLGSYAGIGSDNIHVDTTAGWEAQPELVAKLGHLYVYSDYDEKDGVDIPAIKVGDGVSLVVDLPFTTVDLTDIETAISAIQSALDDKVDKVEGKGLSDNDFTDALKSKLEGIEEGAQVNTVTGVKGDGETDYRTGNINITKGNIGLSNVDNTSDVNKPVSTATQTALDGKVDKVNGKGLSTEDFTTSEKTKLDALPTNDDLTTALNGKVNTTEVGVANGIAELDSTGKVPSSQLPSYVDDVLEYASRSDFPAEGETGKIYVAKDTNLTYRWGGTEYVEISPSLALGETSSTAYRGDRGKTAYDHSQTVSGNPHNVTKTDVGLGNVDNTSDLNKPISTATQTKLDELTTGLSSAVKSVNDITPDSNGNVEVSASDIPANGMGERTTSGNPIEIEDGVAGNALDLSVDIEPIQDLHGYNNPWPAGGGKNLLPLTVAGIKALNSDVTWTGNSFTRFGITITLLEGADGSCLGINQNGTSTSYINLLITPFFDLPAGDYVLNGAVNTSNTNSIKIRDSDGNTIVTTNSGDTVTLSEQISVQARITISASQTLNNVIFYPMLRLATETDPTFEPYSNICPISGRTEANVLRRGFNQWDEEWEVGMIDNSGANAETAVAIRCKNYIPVLSNTTYHFNFPVWCVYYFYDESKQFLQRIINFGINYDVEIPSNVHYVRFFTNTNAGITTYNHDICINISDPSKNGTYEPYAGQSVAIQLGQTVYGGTLDVTTGTLTVRTANIASYNGETIGEPWWSSMDEYVEGTTPTTGAQVVYTLANPIVTTLTPAQLALLEGYNILTTNADTIHLKYIGSEASDVQAEIDEFENVTYKLTAGIAPIEQTTAIATHAVGDYIMLNGEFCKVISAIAVGETITIGTNVSRTTIADELKAIIAQLGA